MFKSVVNIELSGYIFEKNPLTSNCLNIPPWEQSSMARTDRLGVAHYLFFAVLLRHFNKDGLSASSTQTTFYLTIVCVHITVNTLIFIYLGSSTLHFGLKCEISYQLDAIEYLFVFFQLDIFRAYTPIFRSNGCYSFFTYAPYGVL